MSDNRPMCLTSEFAVAIGVGTIGFVTLALLLTDSGLGVHLILLIGVAYCFVTDELILVAKRRIEERRADPSSEEVSA